MSHVTYEAEIGRYINRHTDITKEPYKRDYILQKRPIMLRSLLIVATPYLVLSPYDIYDEYPMWYLYAYRLISVSRAPLWIMKLYFRYLYWTITKILFWNLFTCKGTYMIDWVGRSASQEIHFYTQQHTATYRNTLQHSAQHSTLQHTATHLQSVAITEPSSSSAITASNVSNDPSNAIILFSSWFPCVSPISTNKTSFRTISFSSANKSINRANPLMIVFWLVWVCSVKKKMSNELPCSQEVANHAQKLLE